MSLHKLESSVPFDVGVLVEPLSVAVNAIRLTCGDYILNGLWNKVKRTETNASEKSTVFVIFGDGPIGLLSLVALKTLHKLSCSNKLITIVVGATQERLEKAKTLGAGFLAFS